MRYSEASDNVYTRTITLHGVEVEVEFRFYPAIPATQDEPGCAEEIIIEGVFVDEIEISQLCGGETFRLIEEEILKMWDNRESV